jgi:endogenous inhibitor of DNA gyrase (YacG/DUF329 family)
MDVSPVKITCKMRVPRRNCITAWMRIALYIYAVTSYFFCMPKCPTCGRPAERQDNPWRPFCSERCQLIDFDKWTSEEYRVPGQQINPAEIPVQPSGRDHGEDE